ncbi:MAG: hypothetical protein D3909_16345 [Candidatus Electrothrix sp. ATG1]|nr:hypothetical protein [Candidatus Electrothrix sp. ATG1]MCI5208854.1 hypothetical protein [Candidatus Electrothrix sp. ATG2]
MKKQNCWEVKECGRESGGIRADEFGVCPAAEEGKADGIHDGVNAGRCCWVVAGTLCKGADAQGSYIEKFSGDCQKCDFYAMVKQEEEPNFKIGLSILKEMRKKKG